MQPHRGDLFEMLYPASSRTEDGPAPAHARSFSYADDFHAADDQRIRTSSAASGRVCKVFKNASIRHLLTKVMLYAQTGALRPWWPGCAAVFLCYYMPVRPVSYNRSWPSGSRFR